MAEICVCWNLCKNALPISKDKFADTACIKDNGTLTLTPIVSHASTPTPLFAPTHAKFVAKNTSAKLAKISQIGSKIVCSRLIASSEPDSPLTTRITKKVS